MKQDQESGQAMVEFALAVLVFFTMIMFIFDGGRIMGNYVTVSEAARVGARYAITHGSKSASPVGPGNYTTLRDAVQAKMVGMDSATTTATWANASNAPGSSVTVNVSYSVQPITMLFWAGMTLTLQDHSTMVIQN